MTPLQIAVRDGDLDKAKILWRKFPRERKRLTDKNLFSGGRESLLHLCVGGGSLDTLSFILEQNYLDVNSVDQNFTTPLILALSKNNNKGALLSLQYYADPYKFDKNIRNALHWSVQKGNKQLFEFLWQSYPLLKFIGSSSKQTIMHLAIDHPEILEFMLTQLLLDSEARDKLINTADNYCKPPIFYIINKNDLALVQLFKKAGADLRYQLENGNTLIHDCNKPSIISYLLKKKIRY